MEVNDGGAVALITLLSAAAVAPAKGLVDVLTMAWPNRPTWAAPLAAMVFGIGLVFLTAVAYAITITGQTAAVCVLGGIAAGLASAGITSTGNSAEAKRLEAQGPPPPTDRF